MRLPRIDPILTLAAGANVSPCARLEGMEWRPGRHVDGDFYLPSPPSLQRLRGAEVKTMNDDQTKVMSLRLPNELAAEAKALARAEEVSISEAIRAAIYRHIATRRADKGFQEKRREWLEEDLRTLEQLSDSA